MNGAVHGVATTTARSPVRNAARFSLPPSAAPCPMPIKRVPISKRPARFKPMATIPKPKARFTQGDCSWKPQPTALPAARKASNSAAIAAKATSTPAV